MFSYYFKIKQILSELCRCYFTDGEKFFLNFTTIGCLHFNISASAYAGRSGKIKMFQVLVL